MRAMITAMSTIRVIIKPVALKVLSAIKMVKKLPDIPVIAPRAPGTPA